MTSQELIEHCNSRPGMKAMIQAWYKHREQAEFFDLDRGDARLLADLGLVAVINEFESAPVFLVASRKKATVKVTETGREVFTGVSTL